MFQKNPENRVHFILQAVTLISVLLNVGFMIFFPPIFQLETNAVLLGQARPAVLALSNIKISINQNVPK